MAHQHMTPNTNPMTPDWSHALAQLQFSPYFRGSHGATRWDKFIEAAADYASYDDLPRELQTVYQTAQRQMQRRRGDHQA